MPRISTEKRIFVVQFFKERKSQREIAQILHISRRSVQYILKKFRDHRSVVDRPRCGRPRFLGKHMERRVVRISKGTPTLTARQVRQESSLTNIVSLGTMRRTLRRNGLFGRIAARKPGLNSRHRNNRLPWCREKLSWSVSKWENVIFSDECKIELNSNRRIFVRRSIGNRLKAKYIRSTVKFPRYHGLGRQQWRRFQSHSEV